MTEEKRIAAVEAERLAADEKAAQRREANKLRKRAQRANEREAREQITKQQQAKLAAEQASADAERIKQERIELIRQELIPPIQPDVILEDGTSYWSWVLDEVELYLAEFKHLSFEELYNRLSICAEGRSILEFFGVQALPKPPNGWTYILGKEIQLFKTPSGPTVELWEGLTEAELSERAVAWTKPATPAPNIKYNDSSRQELWDFYNERIQSRSEEVRRKIAAKKRAYADKIKGLELLWKTSRATKAKETRSVPL